MHTYIDFVQKLQFQWHKKTLREKESEIKIIFAKVDVLIRKEAKNYIYQIIVEKLSINKSVKKTIYSRRDLNRN